MDVSCTVDRQGRRVSEWLEAGNLIVTGDNYPRRELLTADGVPPLCVIPGWCRGAEAQDAMVALCWAEYEERIEGDGAMVRRLRRLNGRDVA